jgi:hypothetical protein
MEWNKAAFLQQAIENSGSGINMLTIGLDIIEYLGIAR